MSGNYYPANDEQLDSWMANFLTVLNAHLAQVGLVLTDIEDLQAADATFGTSLGVHVAKQADAQSATATKNANRAAMLDLLRPLVQRINHHPGMDDGLRAALGLKVPTGMRTISAAGEEVPDIYLESKPGRIIVHFGTDPSNEQYNGKPSWARGCNIYRKKTGEADYQFIVFETASPFIDTITGPASDYTYVVQYRGTKSTVVGGPSSPMSIASSGELAA